jgi:hypothetical protein
MPKLVDGKKGERDGREMSGLSDGRSVVEMGGEAC